MQFFALILVNIAMFAIFYLLISLKLEKKATEFREKKLRRIMEEMISEFNETAERNITLLESKIQTMKRMMQAPGGMKGLDMSVADEMETPVEEPQRESGASAAVDPGPDRGHALDAIKSVLNDGAGLISRGIRRIAEKAAQKAGSGVPENHHRDRTYPGLHTGAREVAAEEYPGNRVVMETGTDRVEAPGDVGKDLSALFDGAGDKYALVSDLYARGYSVEDISRSSGIPQGEIRLVLNLGM